MSSPTVLTDTSALPPFGACLAWRPELPWLHIASDGLAALAYWSVPFALAVALRQRRSLALGAVLQQDRVYDRDLVRAIGAAPVL